MSSFSAALRRGLFLLRERAARIVSLARRNVFARLPFSVVERIALASWLVRAVFDARRRSAGIARYEAGLADVALARREALRTMSANVREALFDERLYAGRQLQRDAWPDLRAAAGELAARIRQIRRADPTRPVILSPFHYLSQYANIYVIDEVRRRLGLETISVVSGVPRDVYGNDAAMIPSVQVLYTYDENGKESRNGLGLRVARALRRDGVAVIFADVPPFAFAKFPMETVGVTMRGRHARIHNGVFRLGAPFDAWLLPFYLHFEKRRFGVRVFDPVALAHDDAPQRVADNIVVACRENYPHWLFAGHPSTYHFAPTR
ncbi:hypothetical protein [Paraburkholderia acidisoli]|uniref:Lipid A biosynthesis acyltransferase n=1 Tax=Paraburkholderia acidisoli TaxID=2571748 RepID=A0A7Z2GGJ1_9BURK|nr:hypothetical protein [Paraburkholderia acidisoli]QGZ61391.1 hypothetical protein FAZ98_06405 [Paraburkholderia acidisoli]